MNINDERRKASVRGLREILPSPVDRAKVYGTYIGERVKVAGYEAFMAFHGDAKEFAEVRAKHTTQIETKVAQKVLELV
ncbi:MAG TPA: hypothetical protein VF401_00760 [Candidatus Saccharimonadales bacterium]